MKKMLKNKHMAITWIIPWILLSVMLIGERYVDDTNHDIQSLISSFISLFGEW